MVLLCDYRRPFRCHPCSLPRSHRRSTRHQEMVAKDSDLLRSRVNIPARLRPDVWGFPTVGLADCDVPDGKRRPERRGGVLQRSPPPFGHRRRDGRHFEQGVRLRLPRRRTSSSSPPWYVDDTHRRLDYPVHHGLVRRLVARICLPDLRLGA